MWWRLAWRGEAVPEGIQVDEAGRTTADMPGFLARIIALAAGALASLVTLTDPPVPGSGNLVRDRLTPAEEEDNQLI